MGPLICHSTAVCQHSDLKQGSFTFIQIKILLRICASDQIIRRIFHSCSKVNITHVSIVNIKTILNSCLQFCCKIPRKFRVFHPPVRGEINIVSITILNTAPYIFSIPQQAHKTIYSRLFRRKIQPRIAVGVSADHRVILIQDHDRLRPFCHVNRILDRNVTEGEFFRIGIAGCPLIGIGLAVGMRITKCNVIGILNLITYRLWRTGIYVLPNSNRYYLGIESVRIIMIPVLYVFRVFFSIPVFVSIIILFNIIYCYIVNNQRLYGKRFHEGELYGKAARHFPFTETNAKIIFLPCSQIVRQ